MAPLLLCQKSWKCSLGFSKNPNSPSLFIWIGKNYTQPKTNQHFKIQILNLWINSQNLYPNLSFSVINKMANSHKKGWSHFKLNINDWDIPFPKTLRIYQWFWKNILQWEKWNEFNRNSPHITKCLANMSWRYIFL